MKVIKSVLVKALLLNSLLVGHATASPDITTTSNDSLSSNIKTKKKKKRKNKINVFESSIDLPSLGQLKRTKPLRAVVIENRENPELPPQLLVVTKVRNTIEQQRKARAKGKKAKFRTAVLGPFDFSAGESAKTSSITDPIDSLTFNTVDGPQEFSIVKEGNGFGIKIGDQFLFQAGGAGGTVGLFGAVGPAGPVGPKGEAGTPMTNISAASRILDLSQGNQEVDFPVPVNAKIAKLSNFVGLNLSYDLATNEAIINGVRTNIDASAGTHNSVNPLQIGKTRYGTWIDAQGIHIRDLGGSPFMAKVVNQFQNDMTIEFCG